MLLYFVLHAVDYMGDSRRFCATPNAKLFSVAYLVELLCCVFKAALFCRLKNKMAVMLREDVPMLKLRSSQGHCH